MKSQWFFSGWEIEAGRGPISKPLRIEHSGQPILITGRNGTGKTTLLSSLTDPNISSLVYGGVPPRVKEYHRMFLESFDPKRTFETNIEAYKKATVRGERRFEPLPLEDVMTSELNSGPNIRETVIGPERIEFRLLDPDVSYPLDLLPVHRTEGSHIGINSLKWDSRLIDASVNLSTYTQESFRRWMQSVLNVAGQSHRLTKNPLILESSPREYQSILHLASEWASRVAQRATARFSAALGGTEQLTCSAPEDFHWSIKSLGKKNLAVEEMSSGLRRWIALVVQETLREVEQKIDDSMAETHRAFSDKEFPEFAFPHAEPKLFVGQPSWLVLDEPELHLYPTEVRHLATAIVNLKAASQAVIATHSLEFISTFFGRSDVYMFESPGVILPRNARQSNELLHRLVVDSPAIISHFQLLYVEGKWDEEIIIQVFGKVLESSAILLRQMGGVNSAESVASPTELLGRPTWVLFDGLSRAQIKSEWTSVINRLTEDNREREAQKLLQLAKRGSNEEKAMYGLLARSLTNRLERLVTLVSHGMSDIAEVIHPRRWGFSHDTWDTCGYSGNSRFKDFVLTAQTPNPAELSDDERGRVWSSLLKRAINTPGPDLWEAGRLATLQDTLEPVLTSR
jgi:energy-coupling factor transporter ATP-binding protein EcfA2